MAEHAFEQAAECFARIGDKQNALRSRLRQAFLRWDAGELAQADAILAQVLATTDEPSVRGMALGYRGNVRRARAQYDQMHADYKIAIDLLKTADDALYAATFEMDRGVAWLLQDEFAQAAASLLEASRRSDSVGSDPMLGALIDHYQAICSRALRDFPEAVAARVATFAPPQTVAMRFLQRTHAMLGESMGAAAAGVQLEALRADCPPYQHGRITLELLRRICCQSVPAFDTCLLVDESNRKLVIGNAIHLDLSLYQAEWRIALALAAQASSNSPVPLEVTDLAQVGWPEESLVDGSERNRVHVALSNLRKRGLRSILLRHGRGYALSSLIRVVYLDAQGVSTPIK